VDLAAFEQLGSPNGTAALAAAAALGPTEPTFLACYERMRKHFPADLAKAALETAILREKAKGKFSRAAAMFFTREALEQSSGEAVSQHRAKRFHRFEIVGDFGCGIGGDAIGLAAVTSVIAVDRDPLRLRMAERNVAAYELTERVRFIQADVLADPLPSVDAVFADPARRSDGRRFISLANYQPSPRDLLARFPANLPAAFKLAPAVPWAELEAFRGEAEFVSLNGELKECVLWLGPLVSVRRRATVLPDNESLAADNPDPPLPVGPPKRYLYDPDPAITRAGLVTNLGGRLGATMLDHSIAFLTTDQWHPTPFARGYVVEEVLPFHARRLGELLKTRQVGHVSVLKRGSAVAVEKLVRRWKLTGTEHRFVILTQVSGAAVAIIATQKLPKA
jgi:hypothetical protein